MSKALVIKGANFAKNAIEQISVSDPIPCTGITISKDALTFTKVGATATLIATVEPADTTEAVTWVSSDENVVTVTGGQVTCVGVGAAMITVSCGTQQASCSVIATHVIDMDTIGVIAAKGLTSTDLSVDPPKDYMSVWGQDSGDFLKQLTFFSNVVTPSAIQCISISGEPYASLYPILLPNGASRITVTIPDSLSFGSSRNYIQFADSTQRTTYNLPVKGVLAKTGFLNYKDNIIGKQFSYDVPNIDGVDSFAFCALFTTEISSKPEGMQIVIS